MPDDQHLIFDYHEHHGPFHHVTHDHDQHPRHHHDAGGSVFYLDDLNHVATVRVNAAVHDDDWTDDDVARLLDILTHKHSRTTPPTPTAP